MNRTARQAHYDARVLIDGRLVTRAKVEHGRSSTYENYGCECEPCKEAHRVAQNERRARRRAARVLIDGRLVAPLPPERHGTHSTFSNHGCQCQPCRDAHALAHRKQRAEARS